MCAAVVRYGVDHTIVLWIRGTLEDRLAVVALTGSSLWTAVSRGFPHEACCRSFYGALLLMF